MSAHERAIEAAEIVRKLRRSEFAPLVKALSEPRCFTSNGRINCSAVGRFLGVDTRHVGKMIQRVRDRLGDCY